MLNKFLAGVVALGVIGGIAHAANDQANPPPPPPNQAPAAQGQDDGNQGWWGHGHRHGGMQGGMRGGMGQGMQGGGMQGGGMGPGPMGGPKQAFRLQLGPNVSVGLMCGTQAMKDCIADAQPLIDAAKAAATAQPK